jgi:hypothetical protein
MPVHVRNDLRKRAFTQNGHRTHATPSEWSAKHRQWALERIERIPYGLRMCAVFRLHSKTYVVHSDRQNENVKCRAARRASRRDSERGHRLAHILYEVYSEQHAA